MFQYIYDLFGSDVGFFRIFNYVTFRALMAGLTSMFLSFFLGKRIIAYLYGLKFSETVRTDGPVTHAVKAGTPTMGGTHDYLHACIIRSPLGKFKKSKFNFTHNF